MIKILIINIYLHLSIIWIKKKRDNKGRFAGKDDDNSYHQFNIAFPLIRNINFYILIIIIVSLWAIILEKSNLLQK